MHYQRSEKRYKPVNSKFENIFVFVKKSILDQGSIRSRPRYGLSTPYILTKEQCWTVPQCSYLHGRPAFGPSCTEFSTLDAG